LTMSLTLYLEETDTSRKVPSIYLAPRPPVDIFQCTCSHRQMKAQIFENHCNSPNMARKNSLILPQVTLQCLHCSVQKKHTFVFLHTVTLRKITYSKGYFRQNSFQTKLQ